MATAPANAATAPTWSGGERRVLFWTLLLLLALASWAALALWSASPYGRYLEHGGWIEAGALAALCRAVPQGDIVVPAVLHAAAWVLMIAAMMLPTAFPLLAMFRRITGGRPDAGRLAMRVVAGFFAAWFAFGLARARGRRRAAMAGAPLRLVRRQWLGRRRRGAGRRRGSSSAARSSTAVSKHAGRRSRFVVARWHGRAPAREAFRIGCDHGLFCVGCCWALMLVMFVVGIGSLGWMLALAAVMATEKNLPWGRRLRTPLGLGLLGWAGAIALAHI